jgi:hypothetical protein
MSWRTLLFVLFHLRQIRLLRPLPLRRWWFLCCCRSRPPSSKFGYGVLHGLSPVPHTNVNPRMKQ